jgi:hypothetical protein
MFYETDSASCDFPPGNLSEVFCGFSPSSMEMLQLCRKILSLYIYVAFTVAKLSELIVLLYAILKVVYVHDFGYHDDAGIRGHHKISVVLIQHLVHHSVRYYNYVTQMYEFNFGQHRQADSISPRLYRTIDRKLKT